MGTAIFHSDFLVISVDFSYKKLSYATIVDSQLSLLELYRNKLESENICGHVSRWIELVQLNFNRSRGNRRDPFRSDSCDCVRIRIQCEASSSIGESALIVIERDKHIDDIEHASIYRAEWLSFTDYLCSRDGSGRASNVTSQDNIEVVAVVGREVRSSESHNSSTGWIDIGLRSYTSDL